MSGKVRRVIGILVMALMLAGSLPAYGSIVSIDDSILPVLSLEVSRQDQAVIGEEFTIVYLVKNISDKPAFNIDYTFNIVGSDDTYPFTLTKPDPVAQLDPGASATISAKFAVAEDARERTYRINGRITCKDAGMSATMNYSAMSDVSISFTTVKPNLTVTELQILEENPDTLEGFTVRLTLKNGSVLYDLRNVMVQLDGGDNFEIMDITNRKEIVKISANQSSSVDFKIRSKEGRETNTATLTTSFNYAQGEPEPEDEQLFIPIPEDVSTNGKRPQVIIKRYALSKEQVLAGDRIDLTLDIENTNSRPVKNVLINFGVESMTTDGSSSSSTVFAPVGSSNTFHVDEIRGKSVISNTITFAVDSGATAKTYIVPVRITYEDEKNEFTDLVVTDNVNIPVTQQAKLSVTSMTFPADATVGMPAPVMAEFANSGKVDLADFTVTLEGDFETMDATVYLAKLSIGSTNSYTGMLIASEEGEKEGKLIVSYLDNNNQEVTEEHPFTVNVAAEMVMDPMDPGMMPGMEGEMPPDGGEGNPVVRFFRTNWLAAVLVLAVLGEMIYIIRIKKKAKEDFFDE